MYKRVFFSHRYRRALLKELLPVLNREGMLESRALGNVTLLQLHRKL
jgi:hypothetical protein